MHNLHYVVVSSDSCEEAVLEAAHLLTDWGTENNWRSFGGCVSEDNEVYRVKKSDDWGNSRWIPEENHTIEMINKQVGDWLKPNVYDKEKFDDCANSKVDTFFDWYSAKRHCEHMFQITKHGTKDFNVLQDDLYEYDYGNCGVTQHSLEDKNLKQYVVFMDMHD
jgi:hypothetical protein